jgi:hypothetical protein
MSFTADDTWDVIRFLGLDEESQPAVEVRLSAISVTAPQLVVQVQSILTALAALDTQVQSSVASGLSAIKKADDVEFFEHNQLMALITRMIQLTRQLAKHMKIPADLSALLELYANISGNTVNNEPITINKSMN